MSIHLVTSKAAARVNTYDFWCAINENDLDLPPEKARPNTAIALEKALDYVFPSWLRLSRLLAASPGGQFTHTVTGAHNASDFGLMLSWRKLIGDWAKEEVTTLIICDDPWAFRAFSEIDSVIAGVPPVLFLPWLKHVFRGLLARSKASLLVLRAFVLLRRSAAFAQNQRATLLVYGHPNSSADGEDAYFGSLMKERPDLVRVLHTDCGVKHAKRLMADGRTVSLHGFGSVKEALNLPFLCWRPKFTGYPADLMWLIRRAAAKENAAAGTAMTYWQSICQRRWLKKCSPQVVAWPWENHSWERELINDAKALKVKTIGYQHATFGVQERNHSNASCPDAIASLPNQLICSGKYWLDRLASWGLPENRLYVGGAWRFPIIPKIKHNLDKPVFVALPAQKTIAYQLINALRSIASDGWTFLVKSHPLTPITFRKTEGIVATNIPLSEHSQLHSVIFASSSVGVEARLAGLPTIRFLPEGQIASNVIPHTWDVHTADTKTLKSALERAVPGPPVDSHSIFAPVDRPAWRRWLQIETLLEPLEAPIGAGRWASICRKISQLFNDPVLRRWLSGMLVGKYQKPPSFLAHNPPYLSALPGKDIQYPAIEPTVFSYNKTTAPTDALELILPGRIITIYPGDQAWLFSVALGDSETWLGIQRFSWLPLAKTNVDPAWVSLLYRTWKYYYASARGEWAWHPYTATERAINLIDFAMMHGAPESNTSFKDTLRDHAKEIMTRLEYFGEHYTGNHLANNGRGLFQIGLALGDKFIFLTGYTILIKESERILSPRGILLEGSTHYHLIVTRWYIECWLAARRINLSEAKTLERVCRKMMAVISALVLPGGFPLIGDISPDSPPHFLSGLISKELSMDTWLSKFTKSDLLLIDNLRRDDCPDLAEDGWLRFERGDWAGIWHASPNGWSEMPGHGHQDVGAFELHWKATPIFIDPGRGSYGQTVEAREYQSAAVHNTIQIDGHDPYPTNRPYYDDGFRRDVSAGTTIFSSANSVSVSFDGFTRLQNVGGILRRWAFDENSFTLTDEINGTGTHSILRHLVTQHPVKTKNESVIINVGSFQFTVMGGPLVVRPIKRWVSYGVAEKANAIEFQSYAKLPCALQIRVDISKGKS